MKTRSILVLIIGEICGMSLWFVSAAVLPAMTGEVEISATRQALLSSAVQAGFVAGALLSAITNLSDRYDPRRLFAACAALAAIANLALLVAPIGGSAAIGLRFLTGAFLAGVYPVGMKIAIGWGVTDRGLLVSLLVAALTIGKASPHLAAYFLGADWRATVIGVSLIAAIGGMAALFSRLGPHHAQTQQFDPGVIRLAWTDKRLRYAYGGYLGHMWELFSMWSWIGLAAGISYSASLAEDQALQYAKLTAFACIALGGLACIPAGYFADRIGKAEVAIIAMAGSGFAALLTAASFGGPLWLTCGLILIWGIFIIPDSAQFSALVADAAPADKAGSLMTFQTALGFGLTIVTVQLTPMAAAWLGWPLVLALLAAGPVFGTWSMLRYLAVARHSAGRPAALQRE
jgi:MFS family permease